jgi:hypothetical protein
MMARDLMGKIFGDLEVVDEATPDDKSNRRWNCVCECGRKRVVHGYNLLSGATKSCGCFMAARTIAGRRRKGERSE